MSMRVVLTLRRLLSLADDASELGIVRVPATATDEIRVMECSGGVGMPEPGPVIATPAFPILPFDREFPASLAPRPPHRDRITSSATA
jgi:hypothetical protein